MENYKRKSMNEIGTIASIIAAITGIVAMITGIIAIRNSKGNVIKRIERKQRKIQKIDNQFYQEFGLDANTCTHYPTLTKKQKLEEDINELRKKI